MKYKAWMSRNIDDQTIECLACSHKCKIKNNKTGICGVRKNINNELILLVYGKSISANTDPIEKKPLYHFYPGNEIFSIGTVGCNFRCDFCQNWDISQYHKTASNIEEAGYRLLPQEIIDICQEDKIKFIAFTYNEPAIFFEYAYDTAKLANENGIKTVYVSNGFETKKALKKILPYLDAANIDLKSFSDKFYQKYCGGRLAPVKENIKWLFDNKVWLEITTLLIPGENDSTKELTEIAEFIYKMSPNIPWHISKYYPCYKMKNPETPIKSLEKAYKIGKDTGLNYVYIGNISYTEKENTYCPKCKTCLIERVGYKTKNKLLKNKCIECGFKISGEF